MRVSGAMDSDQGVAVAALVEQREREAERGVPAGLGDHPRAGESTAGRSRSARSPGGRAAGMEDRGTRDRIGARGDAAPRKRRASARRTSASPRFERVRLSRRARRAAGALSTNVASAAPRDSASMPRAPEPANRSSTRAPSRSPSTENSASRTRSAVGRVSAPGGAGAGGRRTGPRSRARPDAIRSRADSIPPFPSGEPATRTPAPTSRPAPGAPSGGRRRGCPAQGRAGLSASAPCRAAGRWLKRRMNLVR